MYFYQSIRFFLLLSVLIVSTGCTDLIRPNYTTDVVKLRPGQYQLDQLHSYLIFRVEHLGLSKIIGRFNTLDATLDFDPDNMQTMQLSASIDANSVDLNNGDLQTTLQEPNWFNSSRYPQIVFNSEAVTVGTDGSMEISGSLSMRGISLPVLLQTKFNGGADNLITRKYTIGFEASAKIKRSEFGMDAFSAVVGDSVEVEVHGEFLRQ